MRIITSFGESETEGEETPLEYPQIFQALTHSLEVAENVFARVAKKAFRQLVGEVPFKESKDARGMLPTWVSEYSIVVVKPPDRENQEWVEALHELLESMSLHLRMSVGERKHVMVDPLSVRIQHIGENIYRFSIKQKWALETPNG